MIGVTVERLQFIYAIIIIIISSTIHLLSLDLLEQSFPFNINNRIQILFLFIYWLLMENF
jgi:hypothetical protein